MHDKNIMLNVSVNPISGLNYHVMNLFQFKKIIFLFPFFCFVLITRPPSSPAEDSRVHHQLKRDETLKNYFETEVLFELTALPGSVLL